MYGEGDGGGDGGGGGGGGGGGVEEFSWGVAEGWRRDGRGEKECQRSVYLVSEECLSRVRGESISCQRRVYLVSEESLSSVLNICEYISGLGAY